MEVVVFAVTPDFAEVFVGEVSAIGDDLFVFGDFVDGVGCPSGTQDDPVEEDRFFVVRILLEVEDNAEFVQVLAETQHGGFVGLVEAVLGADVVELRNFNVVYALGVVFQDITDTWRVLGDALADVLELGDVVYQVALQFIESAIVGEVDVEGFF